MHQNLRKHKVCFLFLLCRWTISWFLAQLLVQRQRLCSVLHLPMTARSSVLQGTSWRMSYPGAVCQWNGGCLTDYTCVTAWKYIFLQFNLKEIKKGKQARHSEAYDVNFFCLGCVPWPRPTSALPPHPSVNPDDEILCNWCLAERVWLSSSKVLFKVFFFLSDRNSIRVAPWWLMVRPETHENGPGFITEECVRAAPFGCMNNDPFPKPCFPSVLPVEQPCMTAFPRSSAGRQHI